MQILSTPFEGFWAMHTLRTYHRRRKYPHAPSPSILAPTLLKATTVLIFFPHRLVLLLPEFHRFYNIFYSLSLNHNERDTLLYQTLMPRFWYKFCLYTNNPASSSKQSHLDGFHNLYQSISTWLLSFPGLSTEILSTMSHTAITPHTQRHKAVSIWFFCHCLSFEVPSSCWCLY